MWQMLVLSFIYLCKYCGKCWFSPLNSFVNNVVYVDSLRESTFTALFKKLFKGEIQQLPHYLQSI
jgi:hypothetical protein